MFIDIHGHTCKGKCFPVAGIPAYTPPEELLAIHDRLGIQCAVLMPAVNPECNMRPQSNEEILEICKDFPGRFIPFCNIDPRAITNRWDAPIGDLLRFYKDKGCSGIGEVCANLNILDPRVQNLFKAAEEVGFPLTFHLSPFVGYFYGLVDDPGLPQLEISLQRFPKLKFFGHSQSFWAEISQIEPINPEEYAGSVKNPPLRPSIDYRISYPKGTIIEGRVPQLMRKYGNLYGDLSAGSGFNALKRDRKYATQFLNEFQDRLMFGTDICTATPMVPLVDFLLELRYSGDISDTVFQKVACQNAEKLLRL